MLTTTFFLKFFGYIMFLMGLAMVLSKPSRDEIINLNKNHTVIQGIINLFLGIPIIILHNIWTGPWEITISLFGWLSVIKGFMRILNLPSINKMRENKMTESGILISAWGALILGCVFMYGAYC